MKPIHPLWPISPCARFEGDGDSDGDGGGGGIALVDAEGNFTDAYRTNLPTYLGDSHTDYKGLDDVKGIAGLAKFAADNHVAARAKLDGHVKIPGEGSTDEEKTEFRTKALTALGMVPPESPEGYEFAQQEGVEADATTDAKLKGIFHAAGVPKAMAETLAGELTKASHESQQAAQVLADQAFDAEANKLKAECPGSDLAVCGREAFNAIMAMSSLDDATKEEIKKAGLYDHPDDLSKWRELGIAPNNLRMWREIGTLTKGSRNERGEGHGGGTDSPLARAKRDYPNSPELWPKE
jgi:hypothetical protein|tara:strand:- start:125 stop:1009 length:885 start_codon:yes stop_codon:yes gene_type:complete